MKTIDKSKPVLVTGATGYVAGRLVEKLLVEGRTVHAAVRTPDNKSKIEHLEALANNLPGTIKYFKSDLLEEGSYDKAMEGCELVYHTASPFFMEVKDAQKDLVDPALKGTRNVLNSVNKTECVKRVVVTSSCAAIYGDAIEVDLLPNKELTEEVWNTTSSVVHQPYSYSKTVAEKEAWKMSKGQDRWDLVTVNPSFVVGPGVKVHSGSESFNIIKQMGDGTMKMGAPDFRIGCVDVRDLAIAHFNAGYTPEAAGRHIISGNDSSFLELASYVRKSFPNMPLPKKKLPKFMVWLFAPAAGMTRKSVKLNVGHSWKANNSKSKEKLNMSYRSLETTVNEFFQQLVDNDVFKKK